MNIEPHDIAFTEARGLMIGGCTVGGENPIILDIVVEQIEMV